MSRRIVVGAAVIAAYVLAALASPLPVRPIFDGLAPPQPYQWVDPPPEFARDNTTPKAITETIELDRKKGSVEASVSTSEGQATLISPHLAFAPEAGQRTVRVTITPLDPTRLGPPPPGLRFDGNAYRMRAVYRPDTSPAKPRIDVTVLLRYPVHATLVAQRTGNAWRTLESKVLAPSLQVYASTPSLGTFVAVGPVSRDWIRWALVGGVSGIAAVLGLALGIRERRRLAREGA